VRGLGDGGKYGQRSWLSACGVQKRLAYEAASLAAMHAHCPRHIPEVYLYDAKAAAISMQYLAPPHVILRHGILEGATYPRVAAHLAELLACSLFRTSALALSAAEFRTQAARFENTEMCGLTEGVRCGGRGEVRQGAI